MSQNDRIIEILERDGQIDNFHCIEEKISYRLGARIADLKALGYSFATEKRGKNYIYFLVSSPKPKQLSLVTNTIR